MVNGQLSRPLGRLALLFLGCYEVVHYWYVVELVMVVDGTS